MQDFLQNSWRITDITWFTEEVWLYLSGNVNSQNSRTRAAEIRYLIHVERLYLDKVAVWGAISSPMIIRPISLEVTVNSTARLRIFFTVCETADDLVTFNKMINMPQANDPHVFEDLVTFKYTWSPSSPHLTLLDFRLCDN